MRFLRNVYVCDQTTWKRCQLCAFRARLVTHHFRDYAQLRCRGASFFLPPFPRCTQDVRIVSPLILAVSADCFLFEHKSHRLTLNCRCLSFPAGEHSIVAFIKSQELCIFKINECAVLNANNMWDHNFVWHFFFLNPFLSPLAGTINPPVPMQP